MEWVDWDAIEFKNRVERKNKSLQRVMNECSSISKDWVNFDPDTDVWTCEECHERSTQSHDAMRHHRDCFVGIAQEAYTGIRRYLQQQ